MQSTDVTILAAPFGFGPTGKSIAIARELISRGYSVKILGDSNSAKLVDDAGILSGTYEYRTEINLADLRSKLVISYLDVSTNIVKSGVPLILADSLFWLRGWYERDIDYPADLILSQRFFLDPPKKTLDKVFGKYGEVGAILSPNFLKPLPAKTQKIMYYPGGLRSPYLGDEYGEAYYNWGLDVLTQSVQLAGWSNDQITIILPPQLNRKGIKDKLKKLSINYLVNCSDTAPHFLSATHSFISPGIETTLESLASGINPFFMPAFNGSHIPQLIADRSAKIGIESSEIYNEGTKKFENGTDNLSKLSMEVEDYTMSKLSDQDMINESVEELKKYLLSDPSLKDRFPLGSDGAKKIADHAEVFLRKEKIQNCYYRVSVKAKIHYKNEVLLVKEDSNYWDFPGGGVEHGEKLIDALRREIKEETGIEEYEMNSVVPEIFIMIDETANRPLLFVIYDIKIIDKSQLKKTRGIEMKFVDEAEIKNEDIQPFLKEQLV